MEKHEEPGPDQITGSARWKILAVLLAAMFMSLVGVSVVNVVLPAIQHTLNASDSDLQWVLTGYALTFGVLLVSAGRAGDVVGRGVVFLAGLIILTLASVYAGFAPDALQLNIARVIQGLGSGLLNPQVIGMIQQYFQGAARARAYGALGTTIGVSVALGPVLGGFLVQGLGEEFGWRATFLMNVPVGALAILLAFLWLPKPLRTAPTVAAIATLADGTQVKPKRSGTDLDPLGSILLGLGILTFMLPFVMGRETPWTWWLLPAAFVVLGLWIVWERKYKSRGREPMMNLELFKIRSFSLGNFIACFYFMGVSCVWVLVPIYVQQALGMSALVAGLMGLPAAVLTAWGGHVAGKHMVRLGRKLVIWGIASAMVGLITTAVLVQLEAGGVLSIWWMLLTLCFVGLAQGAIISPNQALSLVDVPVANSGSAAGLVQTSQRLGSAVGIAVITAIFYSTKQATDAWHTAMTVGFLAIMAMVGLTLVVAIVDYRKGEGLARSVPAN